MMRKTFIIAVLESLEGIFWWFSLGKVISFDGMNKEIFTPIPFSQMKFFSTEYGNVHGNLLKQLFLFCILSQFLLLMNIFHIETLRRILKCPAVNIHFLDVIATIQKEKLLNLYFGVTWKNPLFL